MLVNQSLDIERGQQATDQRCHGTQLHHVGLHDLGSIGVLHLDGDGGAVLPGAAVHLPEARCGDRLGIDVDPLGQLLELLLDRLERLGLGVFVEARERRELRGLVGGQGRGENGERLAELQGRTARLGQRGRQGLDGRSRRLGVDRIAISAEGGCGRRTSQTRAGRDRHGGQRGRSRDESHDVWLLLCGCQSRTALGVLDDVLCHAGEDESVEGCD